MTPSPGPIHPNSAGTPSRVIQGFFPGGRPRIVQASLAPVAPVRPRLSAPIPASPPTPLVPGRPATGALQPLLRPGQPPRPILPTRVQPAAVQPVTPLRARVAQPIQPHSGSPSAVQPHAGDAFPLPGNFTLKPRGSGQPLPEPIQKKMESFFNTSFADVRVHVGHEAPSIGALAFTHGTDLYFAPGQYNPQSSQGQQLLGHELTHVVQQRAGRVRNLLGSGVAVVQDRALEAEAERMGLRAASTAVPIQAKRAGAGPAVPTSQAAGLRPNAVAANGAILPSRSAARDSVQRKPGPILPGKPSALGQTVADTISLARAPVNSALGTPLIGSAPSPILPLRNPGHSVHRPPSHSRTLQRMESPKPTAGHAEDFVILKNGFWLVKKVDPFEAKQYFSWNEPGNKPAAVPDFYGPFEGFFELSIAATKARIYITREEGGRIIDLAASKKDGDLLLLLSNIGQGSGRRPWDLKLGFHTASGTDQARHGEWMPSILFKIARHNLMDYWGPSHEMGFRDEGAHKGGHRGSDNLDALRNLFNTSSLPALHSVKADLEKQLLWVESSQTVYVGSSTLIDIDPRGDTGRSRMIDFAHPIYHTDPSFSEHRRGIITGLENMITMVEDGIMIQEKKRANREQIKAENERWERENPPFSFMATPERPYEEPNPFSFFGTGPKPGEWNPFGNHPGFPSPNFPETLPGLQRGPKGGGKPT
jgi:Domain of unknown function (DUF4157)